MNQNNKKPTDKQKRDAKVTGPASREEVNSAFDKLDKEALDAVVKNVQAELDKRAKLEKLPPKPEPDCRRLAHIYFRGTGSRLDSNKITAILISQHLRELWGKDAVIQTTNGKRGYRVQQSGVDISIDGVGGITLHRSATEKYTVRLRYGQLIAKLKRDYDYDKKFAEKTPGTASEATQKGRIAKIYVPLGKRFARNMRSASEITKVICGLWGKPGDKVEILNKSHGYRSDGANVSISIRGEGDIRIHPSPDLTSGIVTRGELMTRLGYAYGTIAVEPAKQPETTPKDTPEPPSGGLKKAVLVIGMTPNAKARANALLSALLANGYIVETVYSDLVDPAVSPEDLKISLYDHSSTHVHAPHKLHKIWRLEELVKAIQELGEKHAPTKVDPKVVKIAETSGIPAEAPPTTKKAEKPMLVDIFSLPKSRYVSLVHQYCVMDDEKIFTRDKGEREDAIMWAFDTTWKDKKIVYEFGNSGWSNDGDFLCTVAGDFVLLHKELDERHETAAAVKIADLSKYLKDKHFPKAEEPKPVDIFSLPKSRYVSLVHQYCVMDDELVKQFQREIYEATGEMPDDFSQNTRCHSDTVVTVGVLDNRIARVYELKNPDMLKSGEHMVYFNEVTGKVKEILDASGVPYAKAKKPEPVTAEEPTRQYVYMKKRRGLPIGEAYSECVPVAMSKNQKLRIMKLAQEKHKAVGALMRETVLTALKLS